MKAIYKDFNKHLYGNRYLTCSCYLFPYHIKNIFSQSIEIIDKQDNTGCHYRFSIRNIIDFEISIYDNRYLDFNSNYS
jgi:hypothetical protein